MRIAFSRLDARRQRLLAQLGGFEFMHPSAHSKHDHHKLTCLSELLRLDAKLIPTGKEVSRKASDALVSVVSVAREHALGNWDPLDLWIEDSR